MAIVFLIVINLFINYPSMHQSMLIFSPDKFIICVDAFGAFNSIKKTSDI